MCAASILFFLPLSSVSHSTVFLCTWCGSSSSNHFTSIPCSPAPPHFVFTLFLRPCNTSATPLTAPTPSLPSTCHCVIVWLRTLGCLPHFPSSPPLPPLPLLVKERMRLEREEATRLLEEETEVRYSSTAGLQGNCVSASVACWVIVVKLKEKPGSRCFTD